MAVGATVLGVAALGVGVGVAWLGTPAGNAFLLARALALAAPARGTLTADALETHGLHGLELRGIALRDGDGRELARVARVAVDYDLGGVFGRRVRVPDARVEGVTVDLRGAGPGCVDPVALWDLPPSDGAPWTGLGVDLDVGALQVDVERAAVCAAGGPLDLQALTLTAAGSSIGRVVTVDALRVDATLSGPVWAAAPTPLSLQARARWDGASLTVGDPAELVLGAQHVSVAASLDGLDGPAPRVDAQVGNAHVEPAALGLAGLHGTVDVAGTVRGTLDAPEAQLAVVLPGGALTVTAALDRTAAVPTWRATVELPAPVQLAGTIDALRDTRVQGTLSVTGAGLDWPAGLEAAVTADLRGVVEGVGPYTVRTDAEPLRLAQGIVTTPGLRLSGPPGELRTALRIDVPGAAGAAVIADADVDLAGLGVYGAPAGLRGRAHYTGSVRADWADGVGLTLDGKLRGAPVAYGAQVQVAALDGPVRLRWEDGQGQLNATLRLDGLAVPSDGSSARAAHATASVSLDLSPDGAEGRVDVRAADADVVGRRLDLLVADVLLHPGAVDFAAVGGGLPAGTSAEAALSDPALLPAEQVSVEGRYDLPGATLALAHARVAPVAGVDWSLVAPARITLADDRVGVEASAASADGRGALHVAGVVRPRGDCDLDLTLQGLDLAAVGALGLGPALAGRVDAYGHLDGPLRAPRARLSVEASGLVVPGALIAADLKADLRADGSGVDVDAELRAPGAAALARLTGRVPIRPRGEVAAVDMDAPVALALTLPPAGSAAWRAVLEAWPADAPELRLAGQIALAGTLRRPTATFGGTTRARTADGWVSVDLDGDVVDERATLRAVAQQQLVRRAQVSGSVGLALSRLTAMADGAPAPGLDAISALALDLVPLQLPLAAVGAPAALHGSLVGGLHVSGEPLRPRVEGALMVVNGAIGDVAVSPAMLTLTGTDAGYQVDGQLAFGGGGSLRAVGLVPVGAGSDAGALDLRVSGDGVPLAAIGALVPGVSGASGLVKVQGTIGGRPEAPEPDLRLTLDGGAFSVQPLNVDYSAVQVAARLTTGVLSLDALSAVTTSRGTALGPPRPGTLRATGRVALDHFLPGAIRGTLVLADAWVANRTDVALRATSTLQVAGAWPRLSVDGRVDVDEASVVLNESFFTSESSLALDPSITVVRPGAAAARAVAAVSPVDVDFDVRIFLNRRTDVDITIPMEQFGGELTKSLSNLRFALNLDSPDGLRVSRDHGTVQVVGIVEPRSGVANVLGKNFDIAPGGTVAFTGVDYLSPLLGLDAVLATASYGNITAHIAGAAARPAISFRSDAGQSMDDMISVLLFGAPVNELEDQSSSAITAAVQSIFRSQVNQATALTQLDVLELSSAALTVGKRFGKDVLVEVVYNPNTEASSTPVNPVELRVQVPLWKGWYLEGSGGTAGVGAVSAYSRWRF